MNSIHKDETLEVVYRDVKYNKILTTPGEMFDSMLSYDEPLDLYVSDCFGKWKQARIDIANCDSSNIIKVELHAGHDTKVIFDRDIYLGSNTIVQNHTGQPVQIGDLQPNDQIATVNGPIRVISNAPADIDSSSFYNITFLDETKWFRLTYWPGIVYRTNNTTI